jgi:hypothetical protein
MQRLSAIFVMFFVLSGGVGCASVFVKKSSRLDNLEEPRPTLLASAMVRVGEKDDEGGGGLMDAALNIAMNTHLEAFGGKMLEAATGFMAKHGMEVVMDPPRAKKLSLINVGKDMGSALSAVSGVWYSPQGSLKELDASTSFLFGGKQFVEAADDPEVLNEAFVFITGTVLEKSEWLVMKKPVFRMDIRVLDENGEDLMRARGLGEGDASPFVMDRQKHNLEKALNAALAGLEVIEVEKL